MASGRDEWASWKVYLKREGKKGFKLARDSWRESSSTSIEKITSGSDTQDAASTAEPNQGQGSISHANADFQYDPLPGEGSIRLLAIVHRHARRLFWELRVFELCLVRLPNPPPPGSALPSQTGTRPRAPYHSLNKEIFGSACQASCLLRFIVLEL